MNTSPHTYDPREHVNEEPRNDLFDLMAGLIGMFTVMTLVFFGIVLFHFFTS